MTKDELREKANDLPLQPGVYLMMDRTGKVIYVGKAKKLKNRVSQYFQDSASHTLKTRPLNWLTNNCATPSSINWGKWSVRWTILTQFSSPANLRPLCWKIPSSSGICPATTFC